MKRLMMIAAMGAVALTLFSAASASAGQTETRLRTRLTATQAGGLASGQAEFRQRGNEARLSVQVEDVAMNGAGTVVIRRGDAVILSAAINVAGGLGDLDLDSRLGHGVPSIQTGDTVAVTNSAGVLILTGAL